MNSSFTIPPATRPKAINRSENAVASVTYRQRIANRRKRS
jgi:hypothetical protein